MKTALRRAVLLLLIVGCGILVFFGFKRVLGSGPRVHFPTSYENQLEDLKGLAQAIEIACMEQPTNRVLFLTNIVRLPSAEVVDMLRASSVSSMTNWIRRFLHSDDMIVDRWGGPISIQAGRTNNTFILELRSNGTNGRDDLMREYDVGYTYEIEARTIRNAVALSKDLN